ncbi:MAG: beta-hydroxyacyl-ACP dehydratase [Syntrophobacteraceae bacterium]|nr:beta-hydroxyacyl-ACP dehydratase [Syntrophobacteraceae bacterium]
MRYLLVDRITSVEPGKSIAGVKNVAMSEDFLEFHFPKNPIMPGIMLLEALVQLTGWLEAASSDFEKWFLVSRVLKCGFYGFVIPGDRVELSVSCAPAPSKDLVVYGAIAKVNGKRRLKAEFQGNLVELETIEEVEEQKRFFEILKRGV